MSSQKNLYPQIDQSNPNSNPYSQSSSNSMYPSLQNTKDLAENLFPDSAAGEQQNPPPPAIPFESSEEIIVKIPSAIVHLIDKQQSIELASGDLEIIRLRQSGNVVAVLARIGTLIQWPLAKDEAAVKLDGSHYFFTLRVPSNSAAGEDSDQNSGAGKFSRENKNSGAGENSGAGKYSGEKSGGGKYSGGNSGAGEDSGGFSGEELINYGLTISGSGGSEELDRVLEEYSAFRVEEVGREVAAVGGGSEVAAVGGGTAEEKAAAFWTTLAPNVEDYSGSVARLIASGSGQVIKGILWCGDVTVERLKWGNEFLKIRMKSGGKMEVSPETLKRMKRVKKLTKMSENVAIGLLTGVVKVSGFFTGSIVNSKPGKKFFKLLPGEIVLASLDGFNKVCDAVEVAGRNVMSTTSTVTTDLVSHKHGEDAAKVTTEGMHAAGHAIGTAWAVFKIRKALNPKSAVKPTTLVKAAASKSGSSKSKSKSQ